MQHYPINDYTQYFTHHAYFQDQIFPFISKRGISDWDQALPGEQLVSDYFKVDPGRRIILFGCRHGALFAWLASQYPISSFIGIEPNWIALQCLERTIHLHQLNNASTLEYPIDLYPNFHSINTAIIILPKGRKLARRWILEAFNLLTPGGQLLLAGANQSGVQSAIKDASLLFNGHAIWGFKKGARLAIFQKSSEITPFLSWANEPGIAPNTWNEIQISINQQSLLLRSLPGVFSFEHLDPGTRLLLDNLEIPQYSNILDIGCGYGAIGLYAAIMVPTANIYMVDSDIMAIACARENIRINRMANAHAYPSDLFSSCTDNIYDLVVSNPPFHSGMETNYMISNVMIQQACKVIKPGGKITLVANRFLRYEKDLARYFSNVTIRAQTNNFHVITGVR